ncbi:excalibur calcium-binding domain-containing protein [Colwellia sp. KU-HH00111]|uniref:cold shock domain-containing protein n=1 Tax=Colwellia sp. KU-HH00111 TaxID=3127652 RepID=UPI00310C0566
MYRGLLTKWDNAKGFGFIKSSELSSDTFIHISALKHMSRKPKQGDFIHFDVEQHKGKSRATNARIEGVKANSSFEVSKNYKPRSGNKFIYAAVIVAIAAFTFQHLDLGQSNQTQFTPTPIPTQQFTCDGRQHCSQMTSRAEAEFFTKHCPNTKMDGDNDGIPCENDLRF